MKKIKTIFKRIYSDKHCFLAYNEVEPGCEWVLNGNGVATVKHDGTCCLIEDGRLFKRYDAKNGKTPPNDFRPAQDLPDETTGHWPGWIPVDPILKENKWHWEAFYNLPSDIEDGTYELCGPKIQGNPENLTSHQLIRHGSIKIEVGRSFEEIREFLRKNYIEGIVFHRENGEMAKIKRRDFNLNWGK